MSKEKIKKQISSKNELAELRKMIEQGERKLKAGCSHKKPGGKLTIKAVDDEGNVVCEECGEEFNINPLPGKDLIRAIELVHSAIQQCRILSTSEDDSQIVADLGVTDYNIANVLPSLYKDAILNYGKNKKGGKNKNKNKNKNRKDDSFGSYGGFSTLR